MKQALVECIVLALLYVPISSCCLKVGRSAPVPPHKPIIRADLPGAYDMKFGGSHYPTFLLEGGGYVAESTPDDNGKRSRWEGTWELKGDEFTIKERLITLEYLGEWYTYKFTLQKGKVESICKALNLKRMR